MLPLVADEHPLLIQREALGNEIHEIKTQLENLIQENATHLQDQAEYTRRFNELSAEMEAKEAKATSLDEQISALRTHRKSIDLFLLTLDVNVNEYLNHVLTNI